MQIEQTSLPGVLIITPRKFADDRGFFLESYNRATMKDEGIDIDFVQDNHSLSRGAGTVRGLHYQSPPHAQDKLVRVSRGSVYDVAVDVRRGSPDYGKWTGAELSAENGRQLLVPKGFLHGFMTLVDDCEVQYKCSDIYAPDCDGAVRFDDADIGIAWPLPTASTILSEKDIAAPAFADFDTPFIFEG
ncbi:MAG: dTDP-4-dehydrorhamnose 3,5-epimerase [Sphingorhabdus sp.]